MKHPVDTSAWGEFKARDLFGPSKLGKYHNPKDLQASDDGYEYICATTMNNGINQTLSCVISNDLTIPFRIGGGLSLTPSHIIAWGKQNPYFTYHENPCVTSQGMYYLILTDAKTKTAFHYCGQPTLLQHVLDCLERHPNLGSHVFSTSDPS